MCASTRGHIRVAGRVNGQANAWRAARTSKNVSSRPRSPPTWRRAASGRAPWDLAKGFAIVGLPTLKAHPTPPSGPAQAYTLGSQPPLAASRYSRVVASRLGGSAAGRGCCWPMLLLPCSKAKSRSLELDMNLMHTRRRRAFATQIQIQTDTFWLWDPGDLLTS